MSSESNEDLFDLIDRYLRTHDRRQGMETINEEECKHKDVTENDDGWYVCRTCHEELRYNPNKPPVDLAHLYLEQRIQRRRKNRMKTLIKWLDKYKLPFEDDLLDQFTSFIHKYGELFPERKNLISKDYILSHMLRKRGYQIPLKLPKMEKTLAQNEGICRTIFETLDWNF